MTIQENKIQVTGHLTKRKLPTSAIKVVVHSKYHGDYIDNTSIKNKKVMTLESGSTSAKTNEN